MKVKHFLLTLCMVLFCSQAAHAKGIVLFNTGDELFEVGDFPTQLTNALPALSSMKAGYKCNHFGIFWADVWTWDCKLVAMPSDKSYADLPDQVVSQLSGNPEYALKKAKRGFWNHYGLWSVLAALVALALVRKAV